MRKSRPKCARTTYRYGIYSALFVQIFVDSDTPFESIMNGLPDGEVEFNRTQRRLARQRIEICAETFVSRVRLCKTRHAEEYANFGTGNRFRTKAYCCVPKPSKTERRSANASFYFQKTVLAFELSKARHFFAIRLAIATRLGFFDRPLPRRIFEVSWPRCG